MTYSFNDLLDVLASLRCSTISIVPVWFSTLKHWLWETVAIGTPEFEVTLLSEIVLLDVSALLEFY